MPEEVETHARARAILNETLAEHYEEVRGTDPFEATIVGELEELSAFVRDSDTRTFCILMVSFLEDTLKRSFVRHWAISGSAAHDTYFGSNGPLSTFSQRTAVASALSWISDQTESEANILRRIRNRFAHDHKVHSLHEHPILDMVSSLRPYEQIWVELPHYGQGLETTKKETQLRLRLFCAATTIASQILAKSKLIAQGLTGFRPGTGYDGLTGVEQAMIDITVRHCFDAVGADWSGEVS